MRVGRAYIAALCLALVALITFLVVSLAGSGTKLTPAQMESAALNRLHLPAGYLQTHSRCTANRCYVVASPSSQVVAQMPKLLRSAGIQPPGALRAAEPIALLRATHWSTGSSDPFVIACKSAYTPAGARMAVCQDAGRVGGTLVNVLVEPYQSCREPNCTDPARTEVLAWSVALAKPQ